MLKNDDAFHVHLVSDSTGETVAAVARACLVQFTEIRPVQHLWYLVRTPGQLERLLEGIARDPGIVLFTVVDAAIRRRLEEGCRDLGIPCVAVLDPVMTALALTLGKSGTGRPGVQHVLDADYYGRMEAIEFSIDHDDGQRLEELGQADVVLVGVSRTSKTPTCTYLSNRGLKAANIPLVGGIAPPAELLALQGPVIVGLTREPKSLTEIRRNRLQTMQDDASDADYAHFEAVAEEVAEARRLFARQGWPVIDMTRRSIEEAAAAIIPMVEAKGKVIP